MILYHAISTYQLLEMILYRLKKSPKEESILMITDTLKNKFSNINDYLEFFQDVWVYDINIDFPKGKAFQRVINEYFNSFFDKKGVKITEFEEINVACCHYYFGHYLVGNEIPFNFFEDAAGMLSRPDFFIDMEQNKRPFKCKKNIEYGLYDGKNPLFKKCVVNILALKEETRNEYKNLENFNVIQELMNQKQEIREKILSFFGKMPVLNIEHEVSIILTQHLANLGILGFEEQKEMYQLFVDYFFPGKEILVKAHPDDVMNYQNIIHKCGIIKERFPSEFLPLIVNEKAKEITTISSTAIKNFYGCDNDIFELNTDFEKTYKSIHKYYTALHLCKMLDARYETFCCDDTLLDKLVYRNSDINKLERGSDLLIVDDYTNLHFGKDQYEYNEEFLGLVEKKIDSSDYEIIIFLDSKEYTSFYYRDEKVFENIIKIDILIEQEQKEWWGMNGFNNMNVQEIYVYVKNEELRKKIRGFEMKKVLDSSKKVVTVNPLSDYERKAYEGKINALESRLKYYIKLHEESKKEK